MSDEIAVRPGAPRDEAAWRELWHAYCAFYEEDVGEAVTAATWQRLHDPAWPMGVLVAIADDEVVGFANFVVHPSTWSDGAYCYLEDLFVAPAARGRGAGRALIEALRDLAQREGWPTIYWHTRAGNSEARRLYDRFGEADDFVRYVIGA